MPAASRTYTYSCSSHVNVILHLHVYFQPTNAGTTSLCITGLGLVGACRLAPTTCVVLASVREITSGRAQLQARVKSSECMRGTPLPAPHTLSYLGSQEWQYLRSYVLAWITVVLVGDVVGFSACCLHCQVETPKV